MVESDAMLRPSVLSYLGEGERGGPFVQGEPFTAHRTQSSLNLNFSLQAWLSENFLVLNISVQLGWGLYQLFTGKKPVKLFERLTGKAFLYR